MSTVIPPFPGPPEEYARIVEALYSGSVSVWRVDYRHIAWEPDGRTPVAAPAEDFTDYRIDRHSCSPAVYAWVLAWLAHPVPLDPPS